MTDRNAFLSFLDWIDRPGQAVRNLLTGKPGAAGRHFLDFLGEIPDALLPGDVIPNATDEADHVSGSDVVGLDKAAHPIGGFLTDLGVGIATDPLTYLTFGASAALKAAGKAALAAKIGIPFTEAAVEIPGSARAIAAIGDTAKAGVNVARAQPLLKPWVEATESTAKSVGHGVRKTFAALKPNEQVATAEREAKALGGVTRQAAQSYPVEAMANIAPDVQRRAVEMLRGVSSEMGPGYADLGIESATKFITKPEQMQLIEQRLSGMPWADADKLAVRDATEKIIDYTHGQWSQGVGDQVFHMPDSVPATSSIATKQLEQAPADYFPGRYDFQQMTGVPPKTARPAMTAAKEWTTSQELADALTTTGHKLDTNVPSILGEYGEQMGRAAQSAKLGEQYLGPHIPGNGITPTSGFKALTDPESRSRMEDAINALRTAGDVDSAHVLETAFKGIPAPGKFVELLGKLNKPFKAAATGGILIPRLNFTVGNVTSSVWQAFSNKEARAHTGKVLLRVIPTIFGSIGEGLRQLGVHSIPESKAALVAKAARESGGTREGMLSRITDQRLRSAVEHGVLDGGFVNAEQMLADAASRGKGAKSLDNWLYWAQAIPKASEQRMRYGLYSDLLDAGKTESEAARIANETLLSYDIVSAENRTARGAIPFFQFSAKTIPQQAKFLAEQPSVAVGLSQAYGANRDEPVYPYLDKSLNIPIGQDETGNNQYLTSLRMPFEALGMIPNPSGSLRGFGRDIEQSIVGSGHPLLKTAFALTSGKDPSFGTPVGSYSKFPGNIEGGDLGRDYNLLAGTGLIQPAVSIAQTAGKLIDDRMSPLDKSVSLLTGARVQSVDPSRAAQQRIEQQLQQRPDVNQHRTYYSQSADPETQQLIHDYKAAKDAAKKKRLAEQPLL